MWLFDYEATPFWIGILFAGYGIAVIVKPQWGDWRSLNDAAQKRMFGEKGYYILIRFVSGPLLVGIGGWILWAFFK